MTDLEARIRDEYHDWWEVHHKVRVQKPQPSAASLAMSVLHWHHNVESDRRYGHSDGGTVFLRLYAIDATKAWLNEAQDELDTCTDRYRRRDLECLVRNLQRALDDFAHNGPTKEQP